VLRRLRPQVREVDGPPVAGATVLVSSTSGVEAFLSDAAGRFVVPERDGASAWPRELRVNPAWRDRYFLGDSVFAFQGSEGMPVAVELKLQRRRHLSEVAPVEASLTDDALHFTQGESVECRVCLGVQLPDEFAEDATAFEVRVQQDQPARLRLLVVGSLDYTDVLLGESEGSAGSTFVALRIARATLASAQFTPMRYVEKVSGPPSVGLHIALVRVSEESAER